MHTDFFLREFAPLASGPSGVQKLRKLVFNLAISGRLSIQRQDDGNAEVLVQAAAKAIKRAVNSGEIRKPRYFEKPARLDQELLLPPNWVSTTLGSLGLISPRNEAQEDTNSGFVPMAAIEAKYGLPHSFEQRRWGEIKSGYTHIADGDVVLAKITPCFENGKSTAVVNLPSGIGAGTTELHVFRQLEHVVEPAYLLAFLKSGSFIEAGIPKMTGTAGQKRVPADYFALTPFPLPPLAEQQRIVSKVDELMALCDELEARQVEETQLKRATATSGLYHLTKVRTPKEAADRWSILASNFGELFDDLDTIKGLRRAILYLGLRGALVEQRDDEEQPVILMKGLESEPPYELPKNWQWVPFAQIAAFQNGDRSKKYPNKSEYVPEGVPWINTGHIEPDGSLSLTSMNYITEEKFASLGGGKIQPGDLVYCLRGATFGKTAYVEPFERGAIASSLMIIRPGDEIDRRFAFIYLTSPLGREQLKRFDNGTAQPNLSAAAVKKYLVPLPPPAEQKRIVAKVAELMALCDQLEDQVREGERLNKELMDSLVHTLTETDPDGGGAVKPAGFAEDASVTTAPIPANGNVSEKPDTKSAAPPSAPEKLITLEQEPSVDTKFQEAVLVVAIVKTFFEAGGEPIGNFRLQKAVYFARRKMGEHVGEMAYLKKAAGPYNPSMKYSGGIAIAKQKNWLREARGRFGFGHVLGQDAGDADEWIDKYRFGGPTHWVTEHFRYKKNDEWETLATVDYAIEHLSSLDIEPDAAQILQYIAGDPEWRPKIEKLGLTEMSVGTAILEVQALFSAEGGDESV